MTHLKKSTGPPRRDSDTRASRLKLGTPIRRVLSIASPPSTDGHAGSVRFPPTVCHVGHKYPVAEILEIGYSADMRTAGVLFVAVLTILSGCADVDPPQTLPSDAASPDDAGDGWVNCDDSNPCTADIYCALCTQVDSGQCDQPSDESPFCAGRSPGCYYYKRTTPAGQLNDCFPVAGSNPATAGECFDGVCK